MRESNWVYCSVFLFVSLCLCLVLCCSLEQRLRYVMVFYYIIKNLCFISSSYPVIVFPSFVSGFCFKL